MSELNLPPFYIGQKVVSLITKSEYGVSIKKGQEFTVKDMVLCKCGGWKVDIGLRISFYSSIECHACANIFTTNSNAIFVRHTNLAPIEEKFEVISFKKVREQETPLLSPN